MSTRELAVVIPVYNEREVLPKTLNELVGILCSSNRFLKYNFIIVDDASIDQGVEHLKSTWAHRGDDVVLHILTLETNQGHQRAILAGLRYSATLPWNTCLILDADGQDDASAIPSMIEKLDSGFDAIFARRHKRQESLPWIAAYSAYQAIFRILLGQRLSIGNFCVLKRMVVERLILDGDLTHLAATIITYGIRKGDFPVARRPRQGGHSKMSYAALFDYGVAAMTASVRAWTQLFARISLMTTFLTITGLGVVLVIRTFTKLAIPGWSSTIVLLTFSISFQALGFMALTAFLRRILDVVSPPHIPSKLEILSNEESSIKQREVS